MSKALNSFGNKALTQKNAVTKILNIPTEGSRILPSMTHDADWQCRLDAGYYNALTKRLNVVLQVNSQAKSPALQDFIKKNTTHAKLATAEFDTSAKDPRAEYARVLEELLKAGKAKLG
ncbi:hypothetical protein BU16DRAFT_586089 [Lophium mytilinum]|uniref:Uncharacterized protein n=1 Tax=Lophium mytilinum TaxID=390894 RepID=A0A6A6QCY4_9PEZI|nr:hypothetical protein BU16DRAFT_586089 [Lophium mytilinum]